MIKKFKISLKESLLYYQKFGFLQSIKSNETPFVLQISKYLFFGITVTFVHAFIVYGLGYFLNPAIGDSISKELKLNRTIWNNVYAFLVSNSIAFWLNSKFLFKPGRHDKIKEILLFFLISGISFSLGLFAIKHIFTIIETNSSVEHFANLAFIICSASVNFLCRKFMIFEK